MRPLLSGRTTVPPSHLIHTTRDRLLSSGVLMNLLSFSPPIDYEHERGLMVDVRETNSLELTFKVQLCIYIGISSL